MPEIHPPASRLGPLRPYLIALASLAITACGSSGPEMASVYGKVTYQGKPVPKGTVTFITADPAGRNATGQIGEDGSYTLQTEEPGDGAMVGNYSVSVSSKDETILDYIPKTPVPPKYFVPQKFESPTTSGLKQQVKSGRNTIDLDLKD